MSPNDKGTGQVVVQTRTGNQGQSEVSSRRVGRGCLPGRPTELMSTKNVMRVQLEREKASDRDLPPGRGEDGSPDGRGTARGEDGGSGGPDPGNGSLAPGKAELAMETEKPTPCRKLARKGTGRGAGHIQLGESPVGPPGSGKCFFSAVEEGNLLQVRLLHQAGTDLTVLNGDGENALVPALKVRDRGKRVPLFRWLLQRGLDVLHKDKLTNRDAVMWAAYLNRTAELRLAVQSAIADIDVTHVDTFGFTSLHYCVFHNNPATCQTLSALLRRYCVSPDVPDRNLVTPYLHAIRLGHHACANAIKSHVADMTSQEVGEKIAFLQNIQRVKGEGFRVPHATSVTKLTNATDVAPAGGDAKTDTRTIKSKKEKGASDVKFADKDFDNKENVTKISGKPDRCKNRRQKSKRPSTAVGFQSRSGNDEFNREGTASKVTDLKVTNAKVRAKRRECKSALAGGSRRTVTPANLSELPVSSFIPEIPQNHVTPLSATTLPAHMPRGSYREYIPVLFSLYSEVLTGAVLPGAQKRSSSPVEPSQEEGRSPRVQHPSRALARTGFMDAMQAIAAKRMAQRLRARIKNKRRDSKSSSGKTTPSVTIE